MSDLDPGLLRFAEYLDDRLEEIASMQDRIDERLDMVKRTENISDLLDEGYDSLEEMIHEAMIAKSLNNQWLEVFAIRERFYHEKPQYRPDERSGDYN